MFVRRTVRLACAALLALSLGCAQHLNPLALSNQPPEVRLEPAGTPVNGAAGFVHALRWTGADADGRVDYYLVAVNPRSYEATASGWEVTAEHARAVPARRAAPLARIAEEGGREPVIVAVRAVDDRGAVSDPVMRAFFEDNVAPSVRITAPAPSALLTRMVLPTLRIRWEGVDLDGPDGRPVKYKYRLFPLTDPRNQIFRYDPDSLRRAFAPSFAGWDSVPADSLSKTFFDLPPGEQFLFVITAIDAAGDYDPVFSLDKNMLHLRVGFAGGGGGPILTIFNETFYYRYPGSYAGFDSAAWIRVTLPAEKPVTVQWFAQPPPGSILQGYRWVLDPVDPLDATPRRNERRDIHRWSRWSLDHTSATFGPFCGADLDRPHTLYIEALDDLGFLSVGMVRMTLLRTPVERELLIVDDTRLRPDAAVPGRPDSVQGPKGPWPTAAELDTFLYARGGAPWRSYPPGTTSAPGLFSGYDFDTLGTRTGLRDLTVPLATLGRYRNVVWIVDPVSANYTKNGADPNMPETALRYMSGVARANHLAAYVEQGGRLWLMGGGGGLASTIPHNDRTNDRPTLTFVSGGDELRPGRFMWETAHWRSGFRVQGDGPVAFTRTTDDRARGWRYDSHGLPRTLSSRTAAADPLPPLRTAGDFYLTHHDLEFLILPNSITEERSFGGSHRPRIRSCPTLDTLYVATAPHLPAETSLPGGGHTVNPVMTAYEGRDCGPVVFTGFAPWQLTRRDARALVDGVLGGMWGLRRRAGPS